MLDLKNSWFVCLLLLMGCATPQYRVLNSGEYGTEIVTVADRVLLECEDLVDADTPDSFGFMIHVLDEENTVLTFVQGNVLDKGSCDTRLRKIGKILKQGKKIYIAGSNDLSKQRKKGRAEIFPQKGTFYSNGRVVGFAAIANEFGTCFDAYSGDEKPCPRAPFPIGRKEVFVPEK